MQLVADRDGNQRRGHAADQPHGFEEAVADGRRSQQAAEANLTGKQAGQDGQDHRCLEKTQQRLAK